MIIYKKYNEIVLNNLVNNFCFDIYVCFEICLNILSSLDFLKKLNYQNNCLIICYIFLYFKNKYSGILKRNFIINIVINFKIKFIFIILV